MTADVVQATMRLWQAEPEKAKGKPAVTARSEQSRAVIEAGPFIWRSDLPQALGGTNEAPSPTALLLSALAGCAVVFIRDTLAPQLGVRVEAVEAVAQCDTDARGLLGIAGATPDLENVQLSIQIRSPESEERVQQLYQVWQERCPIYLALLKPLQVSTELRVVSG